MKRVGFIINSRVPDWSALRRGMSPLGMLRGWDDRESPMSFMRFRWLAEVLRREGVADYTLYRPGLECDAVVFLKSMGPRCEALARSLRSPGVRIVFEANVDYYTEFTGEPAMEAMAPQADQRANAIAMTQLADGVIASSRHLAEVCAGFNQQSAWVPDNVNLRFVPTELQCEPIRDGRLQVWWSGMASKLFELLAAEEACLAMREKIHLNLVTDSLTAMESWRPDVRSRVEAFLGKIPHTIHPFRGIPDLLALYARGGIIVSPRTLDTPYNFAHSEWKITLGMACQLPAVASPVPSYLDAAAVCDEGAVTICRSPDDWKGALERAMAEPEWLRAAGYAAARGVAEHYSTSVVARRHFAAIGLPS